MGAIHINFMVYYNELLVRLGVTIEVGQAANQDKATKYLRETKLSG